MKDSFSFDIIVKDVTERLCGKKLIKDDDQKHA